MIPKTPQKRKSEQPSGKTDIPNYSYLVANSNSSSPQRSGVRAKLEEPQLKNSQILMEKKGAKGGFGKKYAHQDNIFKSKTSNPAKQYREVVVSDEFVRSHKLYRMLKEQVSIADARHHRESNDLENTLKQEQNQSRAIRMKNHQIKLELWELRNQLIELKNLHQEEQEQNKRLVEEYELANAEDEEGEYDEEGEEQRQGEEEQEQNTNKQGPEEEIVSQLLRSAREHQLGLQSDNEREREE